MRVEGSGARHARLELAIRRGCRTQVVRGQLYDGLLMVASSNIAENVPSCVNGRGTWTSGGDGSGKQGSIHLIIITWLRDS